MEYQLGATNARGSSDSSSRVTSAAAMIAFAHRRTSHPCEVVPLCYIRPHVFCPQLPRYHDRAPPLSMVVGRLALRPSNLSKPMCGCPVAPIVPQLPWA